MTLFFNPVYHAYAEKTDDGGYRLCLGVEGIHCAGCISRIEKKIQGFPHVKTARLNFSTRRLMITWQGVPEDANLFAKSLFEMGYPVQVFRLSKHQGENEEERRLLLALGVSGFAMGNIMLLSLGLWTTDEGTMGIAMRSFFHWISALIAIPAVIWSGMVFFKSAFRALIHGRTNMDVPISVGLILTCGISLFEAVHNGPHAYFDSAVMLMFFLLIGRYLDARVRARARGAANDLLAMMEGTATVREENGLIRTMPINDIKSGMTLLIGMGERIPVDGVVLSGFSHLDLSMVTGESDSIPVYPEDSVLSGSLNISAPLVLRAEKEAEKSFLSDILRMMEAAEQGHARYVRLADRVARFYTPIVHILALAAFFGWVFIGGMDWKNALVIAATVLIITCPCALGLAVPVVQVLAVGQLMRRGILVKAGDALERLAGIDTVIFDKTGTLTSGQPTLKNKQEIKEEDLALAASIASCSKHPLARALMHVYDGPVQFLKVDEFPGQGLVATTEQGQVRLGSAQWCGLKESTRETERHQNAETWLIQPDRDPVRFLFNDPLRQDAPEVVSFFKKQGMEVILLSGDGGSRVEQTAQTLGIDLFFSEQTPAQKFSFLEERQKDGSKIMMVGDGLNDAPVLALSHVSLSPASAMDITQNVADIVFTGQKLGPIITAYQTALFSKQLVWQNFFLSVLYNILAIPLSVLGYVTPFIAAIAMSGSSLVVIANSYRLRKIA